MSEEKQEAYLFIGGVMDGQWVNVPDSANRWNVPILAFTPLGVEKGVPEDFGFNDKYEQEYHRFVILRERDKKLTVFVCSNFTEEFHASYTKVYWDVMCKLVNNYKVIK